MTEQEAKALTLEKLNFYLKHPEIDYMDIDKLPAHLYAAMKDAYNNCVLCSLFCIKEKNGKVCIKCPLRGKGRKWLSNGFQYGCTNYSPDGIRNNISLLLAWEAGK